MTCISSAHAAKRWGISERSVKSVYGEILNTIIKTGRDYGEWNGSIPFDKSIQKQKDDVETESDTVFFGGPAPSDVKGLFASPDQNVGTVSGLYTQSESDTVFLNTANQQMISSPARQKVPFAIPAADDSSRTKNKPQVKKKERPVNRGSFESSNAGFSLKEKIFIIVGCVAILEVIIYIIFGTI